MPTNRYPIQQRLIPQSIKYPGGYIVCPRAEVMLSVKVRYKAPTGFRPLPFIVDIGSDVTMIPVVTAGQYGLTGYDPNRTLQGEHASFGTEFEGRWGNVTIRIGEKETTLICFYYVDSSPKSHLHNITNFILRNKTTTSPIILGRAGFLEAHTLVLENGWVVISNRPVLSL